MQVADPAFTIDSARWQTTSRRAERLTVKVIFTPTAAKSYSSQIVVTSGNQQKTLCLGSRYGTTERSAAARSRQPRVAGECHSFAVWQCADWQDTQQSLTLTSSGTAPLQISSLSAQGNDFLGASTVLAADIAARPGLASACEVRPEDLRSKDRATHRLQAMRPQTPSVTVTLVGNADAPAPPPPPGSGTPALTLSSTAVSFGSVAVGSQGSNSVTLTSSGTAAVVLQSLTVNGDGFAAGQVHCR